MLLKNGEKWDTFIIFRGSKTKLGPKCKCNSTVCSCRRVIFFAICDFDRN